MAPKKSISSLYTALGVDRLKHRNGIEIFAPLVTFHKNSRRGTYAVHTARGWGGRTAKGTGPRYRLNPSSKALIKPEDKIKHPAC